MRIVTGNRWPVSFLLLALVTCSTPRPGSFLERRGDEIVVCGQLVHTGTPVVLWMDPGGYDAYRVEKRFSDGAPKEPLRYGIRKDGLTPEQLKQVRGGGWDLPLLQNVVDQFVLHYDVSGTSRRCFRVLHDMRGLSVHFLLDIDGTIYQTLDLKERAWHATTSNTRSIGIEIANIGAYGAEDPFEKWYVQGGDGVRLRIPEGENLPATLRPDRPGIITGRIQGRELRQYDFTSEQYAALVKLTAALCSVFPKMRCDYPRDADGRLVRKKLPDDELRKFQGVLGHFHVQANKVDPGPAFQWQRVIDGARKLMDP